MCDIHYLHAAKGPEAIIRASWRSLPQENAESWVINSARAVIEDETYRVPPDAWHNYMEANVRTEMQFARTFGNGPDGFLDRVRSMAAARIEHG